MSVNKNLVNVGHHRKKKIPFLWSSKTSSFGMKEKAERFAAQDLHEGVTSSTPGLHVYPRRMSRDKINQNHWSEIHFQLLGLGHFPYGLFTLQREINSTMGYLCREHVITHFCQKSRWWHLFVFWVVLALPCWQASQFSLVCHKAETLWILGCTWIDTMCSWLSISSGFPVSSWSGKIRRRGERKWTVQTRNNVRCHINHIG